MPSATFTFENTPMGIREGVRETVQRQTLATVRFDLRGENTGTLTLIAESQKDVDEAVNLITEHWRHFHRQAA